MAQPESKITQLTSNLDEVRSFFKKEWNMEFGDTAKLNIGGKIYEYLFYYDEETCYPIMEFDCRCQIYVDEEGSYWFLQPSHAERINNEFASVG